MKKFIKTYYNINVEKIYKNKNNYFFYSGNDLIYIIKTDKNKEELDNLVNISNSIYHKNNNTSTFLLNKEGNYYTKYDGSYLVLLKYNDIIKDRIEFNDIFYYPIENNLLLNYDILNHFKNQIDVLEKEIQEYNKEHSLIQKSIDYFIGISENAIQLLSDINISYDSICHNIGLTNYNKVEYNNPFNYIKANIMYDYANYFKYKFYYETINYDELYYLIKNSNINDLILFFGLMLYQEEYFNLVKQILLDKQNEEDLNIYINHISDYKELLLYIKDSIRNVDKIREIEWLDK